MLIYVVAMHECSIEITKRWYRRVSSDRGIVRTHKSTPLNWGDGMNDFCSLLSTQHFLSVESVMIVKTKCLVTPSYYSVTASSVLARFCVW